MYHKEIEALKHAGRFRERRVFDAHLVDLASNDYLGLANNKKQFRKTVRLVENYSTFAPKASMLVNGYHSIHARFEERIAVLNGFERGLAVGSGFLANIALIESLVRKGDRLFMDEEYHASGVMAAKLLSEKVIYFRHNDPDDLLEKLGRYGGKRNIIAIEGIYSMSGDMCRKEIFEIAQKSEALLIVDEAHSSGVVGERLLGVFEYYGIEVKPNHIKMGTLGKAFGSYGAYILASHEIITYLENRAKPIIYSTAPSIFDIALALNNIEHISKKSKEYHQKIIERQKIVKKILKRDIPALIVSKRFTTNEEVMRAQKRFEAEGMVVGAIRRPTVSEPIIRLIPRLGVPKQIVKSALRLLQEEMYEV
jgi:8-amino-7-oxononanoate synthase